MNPEFRKKVRNRFGINQTFGNGDAVYGEVHLHSLKEDIEQIEPIAFEHFVGDVFKELGYKTKVTSDKKDFGGDVVAKKGGDTIIIQVKHRNSSDWLVSNDAVQQAVAAMPVYKANKSMVVTNGEFTEHAYKQARFSETLMIDGKQLISLVKQVMAQESNKERSEDITEAIVSNDQDGETRRTLANHSNDESDIIKILDSIPPTAKEIETMRVMDLDRGLDSESEFNDLENTEKIEVNLGSRSMQSKEITQVDCLAKQVERVLSDTIPEVTLEGTVQEELLEEKLREIEKAEENNTNRATMEKASSNDDLDSEAESKPQHHSDASNS